MKSISFQTKILTSTCFFAGDIKFATQISPLLKHNLFISIGPKDEMFGTDSTKQ